jgi:poly(A) polymerase
MHVLDRELTAEEISQLLAHAFCEAGQELFLVGGSVRDELLGNQPGDIDFATSAPPAETARLVEGLGQGVYRIGEKYGTIGVPFPGRTVEITTYRSEEIYAPGSRKPVVRFGRTIHEDLARRDFTINAIAREALSGAIIDPLHGQDDLAAATIRAVGDPIERFREDPLRILRAARFAARLHFTIEPSTWDAMCHTASLLRTISRERIRDEYSNILTGPDPVRGMTLLRDAGLLAETVPELLALTEMADHGPRHPLSLWDHTMRVVSGVYPELAVRWAALLHDIAKPATRTTEPSGRPRFFHHEEVGSEIARDILTGLRYNKDVVDAVSLLVSSHMQLHAYTPAWSDGAVRRLMLRLGPLMEAALMLARADAAGHTVDGRSENAPKFDELERRVHEEGMGKVQRLSSPLTGNDLMDRYHRPPGPWIKRIKDDLLARVLEGTLEPHDREAAWALADALMGTGRLD